jgi:hypothetical protein
MEENSEYIDESFLVHLLVVNMKDGNKLHRELKISYPMNQVVMEAVIQKIDIFNNLMN